MQIKWQIALLLLIAAFLLGLLLSGKTSVTSSDHTTHEREIIRSHLDTARSTVTVPLSHIAVSGKSNRTVTRTVHDTLYRARCFDSLLVTDTAAIAPDTLSLCYEPRADSFAATLWLSARRKEVLVPYVAHDTFYWRSDSVQLSASSSTHWYDELLMIAVSIAAGIVIAKL